MKRTRLNLVGHSTTADLKKDIQATLREIALLKYQKTCVLSPWPETGACGPHRSDGELVLQAEHLNSRSHTGTFGDMRNIILLCQRHHIYWKPQNSKRYWEIVREVIGEQRWAWLERVQADRTPQKVDLKLVLVALKQELRTLQENVITP